MNKNERIIIHMLTHSIKRLAELQRRLSQLNEIKDGDPLVKQADIVALSTETIELLGNIEPALPLGLQYLPEFKVWIVSAQEAITRIKADAGINGNICECKGCTCKE
jgi:hypothetical protein